MHLTYCYRRCVADGSNQYKKEVCKLNKVAPVFKCQTPFDGYCIDVNFVCDGEKDCQPGSDLSEDEFGCRNLDARSEEGNENAE